VSDSLLALSLPGDSLEGALELDNGAMFHFSASPRRLSSAVQGRILSVQHGLIVEPTGDTCLFLLYHNGGNQLIFR